jgi:hypothetical protein
LWPAVIKVLTKLLKTNPVKYNYKVDSEVSTFLYLSMGIQSRDVQIPGTNQFRMVTPNIYRVFSMGLAYFTLLAPRNVKRLIDFWKIGVSLIQAELNQS